MNFDMFTSPLATAIYGAALAGLLAAVKTDYDAFKTWQNWHSFAEYNWSTATLRWVKGAVAGALSALAVAGVGTLAG